jgi:anaerobic magnesium-protoporphyrin IX monomethyl ester cyclase
MKICLLFPPHWTPAMPYLALPWLTGFLRQNGHNVLQRDLNIEVFDTILTRRHLRHSVERIRRRFHPSASRKSHLTSSTIAQLPHPHPGDEIVQWAFEKGPGLADKVEKAKAVLRSEQFYSGEACLPAFLTIVDALELASLAYFPARLDLAGFSDPLRPDASVDLLKTAGDPELNLFYEIFQRGILPDLKREQPDLIGISIPTQGQLLAAITLAVLIRQAGLKCHITAGGPHVTMLREQLPSAPALFDLFDSFVVFDGELPLLHLIEALECNGDLSSVPNLIYRQAGSMDICTTPILPVDEVRQVQQSILPDYDGLPLERYLAPELVLPLATAHGCYHGKCGFCNVGYGNPFHYYPYPVEHVTRQIERVYEKYKCRHIFFVDEAVPPRTLRHLSAAMNEQALPVNWCGAVRFEKALTDPLLAQISASGCRMLLFGLESAAEPIMKCMIKGTQREEMSRILRGAARAGIWNHVFFFFGFPGETLADAQETVNFVYAHQDAIHSASPGAFLLERYAPAHRFPQKFGIRHIHTDPQRDLAIYFDYEAESGLDEHTANLLADKLIDQLPDKRYGQYYFSDVYKFLFTSELRRQDQPLPRWIDRLE